MPSTSAQTSTAASVSGGTSVDSVAVVSSVDASQDPSEDSADGRFLYKQNNKTIET